jgi:hypothetical protein
VSTFVGTRHASFRAMIYDGAAMKFISNFANPLPRRVATAPGAAINSEPFERIEFRHSRISTRDLGARALTLFFHRDAHPEAASDSLDALSRSTRLRQSRECQQPCPQRDFGGTLIGSTSRLAKRGRNRIAEFDKLVLRSSQMIQPIRVRAVWTAVSSQLPMNHLFDSEH